MNEKNEFLVRENSFITKLFSQDKETIKIAIYFQDDEYTWRQIFLNIPKEKCNEI